jgi:hypothetical protein
MSKHGTRLSKEHFWQIEHLNKQAFVPTEERGLEVRFHEAAYRAFYWFLVGRGIDPSRLALPPSIPKRRSVRGEYY